MPDEFEKSCRDLNGAAAILPGRFEAKARTEIIRACSAIAHKIKTKAQDVEHVARGEIGMLSAGTLKQLKDFAKAEGKKHSSKRQKFKMSDVQKPTKGEGKQIRLKVPGTYGGFDVHLMVNVDEDKLKDAELDLLGSGVGLSRKIGNRTKVDARYLRGTAGEQTTHGGSVLVTVSF